MGQGGGAQAEAGNDEVFKGFKEATSRLDRENCEGEEAKGGWVVEYT